MKINPGPSATRARELLSYNKETGTIRWKVYRGGKAKVGSVAGNYSSDADHIQIMIDRKIFSAHQLAWLIVTGKWPKEEIDHRDLDGRNNKWNNLRESTRQQNMMNRRTWGATGFKGVSIRKSCTFKPYCARITINRRTMHIGYYATVEEAHSAYVTAATKAFGEYARAA